MMGTLNSGLPTPLLRFLRRRYNMSFSGAVICVPRKKPAPMDMKFRLPMPALMRYCPVQSRGNVDSMRYIRPYRYAM